MPTDLGRAISLAALVLWPLAAVGAQERSRPSEAIPARPEALLGRPAEAVVPSAEGTRHELSNGVPVYVVEDDTAPLLSVTLAMPIGELHDLPQAPGVATLTAAMMRRGGAGARDADAFDEEVAYLGISLDSVGGGRRSGLSLEASTRVLAPALDLFADVLLRPRFQQDRLDLALANLRASLEHRRDSALRVLDLEWRRLMFGKRHYRGRWLEPSDLGRIDRERLVSWHRTQWSPTGAVLAVAGAVRAEEVLAELERRLGAWTGTTARQPVPPEALEIERAEPGIYLVDFATPQVKVRLGHGGYRRESWSDPEAFALTLLGEVLDGRGAVSRLRSRLRARDGLVYRVSGSIGVGSEEAGLFEVFLEAEPENAPRAIAAVLEEIGRLRREPVPEAELDLARRAVLDAFPLLFETAEQVAGRFAEDELLGRPHGYWQRFRERLSAVTPADLRRVARRHLQPEELRLLWVGPRPAAGTLEALAMAGGVHDVGGAGE